MSGKKLYFPLAEVAALTEATRAATEHTDSWMDSEDGRTTGPALMWVKDDGTYLMSNVVRAEGEMPTVIFGRAYSPDGPLVGSGAWDLAREMCGGDDFAEYLTVGAGDNMGDLILSAHRDGLRWFVLEVERESISIGVE